MDYNQRFSWGVCVWDFKGHICQSVDGVTENSFKIPQEVVSNSLKVMGSINVFSVLFLNLFFCTSCIFLWESRNLLLQNLMCFLIRLTLHIIYVDCFIYTAISLPPLSFLVWFKATPLPDETQPLSPGGWSLAWLLLCISPHLWKSTAWSYPIFFPFLLTPWFPAQSTKYFPCSNDRKVDQCPCGGRLKVGEGGENVTLSVARKIKCPFAQDMPWWDIETLKEYD